MLTYVGQGGSALFALLLPEWWEGIGTSFALISEKEDNTCQPSMRGGAVKVALEHLEALFTVPVDGDTSRFF